MLEHPLQRPTEAPPAAQPTRGAYRTALAHHDGASARPAPLAVSATLPSLLWRPATRDVGLRPAELWRPARERSAEPGIDPVHSAAQRHVASAPLVWPRSEGVPAAVPSEPSDIERTATKAGGAATTTPNRTAATATLSAPMREAVRSTAMQSLDTDRIAEDVLRKVEKRLRIERERRGL